MKKFLLVALFIVGTSQAETPNPEIPGTEPAGSPSARVENPASHAAIPATPVAPAATAPLPKPKEEAADVQKMIREAWKTCSEVRPDSGGRAIPLPGIY